MEVVTSLLRKRLPITNEMVPSHLSLFEFVIIVLEAAFNESHNSCFLVAGA